jgi:SET domain-containing protein
VLVFIRLGKAPLYARAHDSQGWGLRALQPLPRGAFVCEYAGEPLTTTEARARLEAYDASGGGHALLVARLVLPSGGAALRLNVDATAKGNVARCGARELGRLRILRSRGFGGGAAL